MTDEIERRIAALDEHFKHELTRLGAETMACRFVTEVLLANFMAGLPDRATVEAFMSDLRALSAGYEGPSDLSDDRAFWTSEAAVRCADAIERLISSAAARLPRQG